ncbi:hypothetical protein BDV38DRAFT_287329 [Aspergillus pseudotamarii]|uniref:Peptidase C1A papain C-terminal domain-containing protein n=1 Tax=Aspergillus pseudotamarii TaxID=132259 RepID=A0A5N6SIC3_ASPPS|nr:uncharacterized protein BDV38DRAFT_287329 [Aspergillus pseudotamarii]KAE8132854.1 hypothetical protein BDV38DRAFT_287329 [Aspergillus pseudotamarii]
MFFKALADATECNTKLGVGALEIARRAQNGVSNAIGINKVLPSAVQKLTNRVYDTNKNIVRRVGHGSARILRPEDFTVDETENAMVMEDASLIKHVRLIKDASLTEGADLIYRVKTTINLKNHQEPSTSSGLYHFQSACPDLPDSRDHIYEAEDRTLRRRVDLRPSCPPVYDQLKAASCVANAIAGAYEFISMKQNLHFSPSRLFIWYYGRQMTHPDDRDAVLKNLGMSFREVTASVQNKTGHMKIAEYNAKTKYFVPGAKAAKKPAARAQKRAHQHATVKYFSFPGKERKKLKDSLDRGYPFLFLLVPSDGLKRIGGDYGYTLKMPTPAELKKWKGRHGLLAVGYDDDDNEEVFIVRNSWGARWGDGGYFYMPYAYLKSCSDIWTIRLVKGLSPYSIQGWSLVKAAGLCANPSIDKVPDCPFSQSNAVKEF